VTETKDKFDEAELAKTVGLMVDDARAFILENIEGRRETATDYYMGRPFGDEVDGRSKVVMTEVRDTVHSILPSLLRLYCGNERYVEFRPRPHVDPQVAQQRERLARQQTDAVNYVVMEDNPGFEVLYSAFMDGMVRLTGFVKWHWHEEERIESKDRLGLNREQVLKMFAEVGDDTEIEFLKEPYQVAGSEDVFYDVKVTRTLKEGKCVIEAPPPEEISWNRSARSLREALIVTHSREMRKDELIAMGYDAEQIENAVGSMDLADESTGSKSARRFDSGQGSEGEDAQDEATRPVAYHESYAYVIGDEKDHAKGIASLWKICMISGVDEDGEKGGGYAILHKRRVSHRPIVSFSPKPEPHTVVGLDVASDTMDLQRIQSRLMRGTLDSMALAIDPKLGVLEGAVNVSDLQNNEIGGFVRMKVLDAVREIKHSFVADSTLPLMEYMQDVRANRTGITKQSAGLDADAMQSTTKQAVSSTLQKAQERIEFMARVFAEPMREMYKGIYLTLVENQDDARLMRLRGEVVEVDPREWDEVVDVKVNVALGSGMVEDRKNSLREIVQKQFESIQIYGPVNPLCTMANLRSTLARMAEMDGWANPDEFWNRVSPEQEQELAKAAANPPQPPGDPVAMAQAQAEMAKVQILQQKTQADIQHQQAELQLRMREMQQADALAQQTLAADTALRYAELQMKHGHATTKVEVDAMIAREAAVIDAAVQHAKQDADNDTKVEVAKINAAAKKESAPSE
jgi:hypothetical protein